MRMKVKYERKVGEPTTMVATVTIGEQVEVREVPNQDANLTALDAAGKLGVELGER